MLVSFFLSSHLRSWWWTGRPGVLRFMGSQRVEHDWATELNPSTISTSYYLCCVYVAFWPEQAKWTPFLRSWVLLQGYQSSVNRQCYIKWPEAHAVWFLPKPILCKALDPLKDCQAYFVNYWSSSSTFPSKNLNPRFFVFLYRLLVTHTVSSATLNLALTRKWLPDLPIMWMLNLANLQLLPPKLW